MACDWLRRGARFGPTCRLPLRTNPITRRWKQGRFQTIERRRPDEHGKTTLQPTALLGSPQLSPATRQWQAMVTRCGLEQTAAERRFITFHWRSLLGMHPFLTFYFVLIYVDLARSGSEMNLRAARWFALCGHSFNLLSILSWFDFLVACIVARCKADWFPHLLSTFLFLALQLQSVSTNSSAAIDRFIPLTSALNCSSKPCNMPHILLN
jgi:hypothetical protein